MNRHHRGYRIQLPPKTRWLMIALGCATRHKHTIYGLVEVDVTGPRRLMEEHKARTGEAPSLEREKRWKNVVCCPTRIASFEPNGEEDGKKGGEHLVE